MIDILPENTGTLVYDLHSHSNVSDGHLSPQQLVLRAVEKGVDVLAITDHDSLAGLQQAHETIREHNLPLQLINGVEISTTWHGFDIHIVGLNIDISNEKLKTLLAEQAVCREKRALEIGARFEKLGFPDALDGALKIADGAGVTRAHFARYLVESDKVSSMEKVFRKYLSKGKLAYVPAHWGTIQQAIEGIQAAGGKAILAHPTRYDLSTKWLKRLITEFKADMGDGIEVTLSRQTPTQRSQLAKFAQELDLLASAGSDFHYPCGWLELGRNLSLPDDVKPVWQHW